MTTMEGSKFSLPHAATVRLFWGIVEQTTAQSIRDLGDAEIGRYFVRQINNQRLLSTDELGNLSRYIDSHVLLIRDLTEEYYSQVYA
jgi:hypothetical protein